MRFGRPRCGRPRLALDRALTVTPSSANGAGRRASSSALRELQPTSGEVYFKGERITHSAWPACAARHRQELSDHANLPKLSVAENVLVPALAGREGLSVRRIRTAGVEGATQSRSCARASRTARGGRCARPLCRTAKSGVSSCARAGNEPRCCCSTSPRGDESRRAECDGGVLQGLARASRCHRRARHDVVFGLADRVVVLAGRA